MQYIIALFGAKLSFRDISHTYISHYTTDVFEALPLPALTGTYKHFLAVYLAENELTKLPNSGLFAHNLALTLQHYESQKSLTKTIEFEGSLQGGAGKLEIGIYPWKFKFAKYDEWTPVFGVIGVGVQLFSLLRSPASWLSSVLMLVMILTILIGFSRARVYKLNEKKTDNDLDFIQKQETTYFSRENIFDAIAAKVCRDFFAKINFSSFWYHTKKYPTPLDMLKVYPQKWKEIDYMRLDLLRDYKFDMSSKDMLEAQKYVLGLRFLKSFQYFKKVASILIDNRIQTTFYVKMLNIYVTTQGFYGNFWIPSQARNFQHKLKLTQILHTDAPPRPALVGKANEKLADWVTEQTRLLTDTHLAYELQQLEYYVQNYLASPAEKVPFVLDMEELVVFF